jgi:hypothetical protein
VALKVIVLFVAVSITYAKFAQLTKRNLLLTSKKSTETIFLVILKLKATLKSVRLMIRIGLWLSVSSMANALSLLNLTSYVVPA